MSDQNGVLSEGMESTPMIRTQLTLYMTNRPGELARATGPGSQSRPGVGPVSIWV